MPLLVTIGNFVNKAFDKLVSATGEVFVFQAILVVLLSVYAPNITSPFTSVNWA